MIKEQYSVDYMQKERAGIIPEVVRGIGDVANTAFGIMKIMVSGITDLRNPEVSIFRRHPKSDISIQDFHTFGS